jgi:hypothetical protein
MRLSSTQQTLLKNLKEQKERYDHKVREAEYNLRIAKEGAKTACRALINDCTQDNIAVRQIHLAMGFKSVNQLENFLHDYGDRKSTMKELLAKPVASQDDILKNLKPVGAEPIWVEQWNGWGNVTFPDGSEVVVLVLQDGDIRRPSKEVDPSGHWACTDEQWEQIKEIGNRYWGMFAYTNGVANEETRYFPNVYHKGTGEFWYRQDEVTGKRLDGKTPVPTTRDTGNKKQVEYDENGDVFTGIEDFDDTVDD